MCTSSDIFLTRTPWLYLETGKTLISSYESVLRIAICMPLVWAYFCLWIGFMDVIGMALWVSLSWTDGCRWYCPFKWKIKDTTQFPNPKEIYMYAICMDLRMPLGWTYMYVGRHELWMPLSSAYDCWWRGYIDAVGCPWHVITVGMCLWFRSWYMHIILKLTCDYGWYCRHRRICVTYGINDCCLMWSYILVEVF